LNKEIIQTILKYLVKLLCR